MHVRNNFLFYLLTFGVIGVHKGSDARELLDDIIVDNDPGSCSAIVHFKLSDAPSPFPAYSTPESGHDFVVGTTHVLVQPRRFDSFDVTVNDVEAPELSSQDTTYVIDQNTGTVSLDVTESRALTEAKDNCGLVGEPEIDVPTEYTCEHLDSSFDVTIQQADGAGNIGSTTFRAKIVDEYGVCTPRFTFPSRNSFFHSTAGSFLVGNVNAKATKFADAELEVDDLSYNITGGKDADKFLLASKTGRLVSNAVVEVDTCSDDKCEVEVTTTNYLGLKATILVKFRVHEKPTLSNVDDIQAEADESCQAEVNFDPQADSTDPGVSIVTSKESGFYFDLGVTYVEVKLTTSDGYVLHHTFSVTVFEGRNFDCSIPARRLRGSAET